ncbi:beta-N-acetylhexosaminidase [Aurantiacibacter sediminis]|uniref:beta-N-acetylhexosaminidase n=1 Tax=Aurantiacibacter sediminis TaxID=2793064 RepID=A0ABS0N6C2_9SPHN|nr:beta-N-acetylhexosaminidase [Aurantiacibacter sediminis]MBH5323336.1 beta-N-acetylhexosaminidase [Aurantiacibacter sediminis]
MTPAIFSLSGPQLTDAERAFFKEADPAGYILFGRNVETREQLRALTDDLRSIHGREKLLISIDQEGGRVSRMKPPEWTAYPPQGVFAQLYEIAPASAIQAVRANAQLLAMDLHEVGITVDYLPLLDVRVEGSHDVIGDRALGAEPMQVAALGRAVLDGLARGGVAGCIKHMPGHGRAMVDSHKDLPVVEASAEELQVDIAPFQKLADAPIGMSAHIRYPTWDRDNPATLSEKVIGEIIRGRIGFDGLLLTDDIDMEALEGTIPERSARAIAAGCDVVLNCWGKMDDMEGTMKAVPAMTDAAHARLDRALADTGTPGDSASRDKLVAQRDGLLEAAGVQA